MKTITCRLIALAIAVSGIIFSHNVNAACNAPTGMNSSGITSAAATLNWTAVSGAIGYNVQYKLVSSSTWSSSITVTSPTYTLTSLSGATAYNWKVQTKCTTTQTSAWTANQTFTTLITCNTPSGLSATGITQTGATLNWSSVSGAAIYNVQYRITGAPSWTSTTSSTTSKVLISLTAGSNYEFQVQTNCGGSNNSAFSSSSTFSTLIVCNVPTGLITADIVSNSANLKWTLEPGAAGYNVQYRQVGSPSWNTISSPSSPVTISSLSPVTNYEWKIQTDCGVGNQSAYSGVITFTTSAIACNTPFDLNTNSVSSTSVTLLWSNISSAVSYNVQYRVVGTPTWSLVTSTIPTANLSSLAFGAAYEWNVQSNCGGSNLSAYSAAASFSTSPLLVCTTPFNLSATDIALTSVTLKWSGDIYSLNFNLQYREVGAATWITVPVNATAAVITGLNHSTSYEWQVQADCGHSYISSYSTSSAFSTLTPSGCNDVPSSLTVSNITPISATLSWTSGSNEAIASSYEVQYREVGNPSWNTLTSATTSFSLTTLTQGTNYEWQARRYCGNFAYSAYSSINTFASATHAGPLNVSQYISAVPNLSDPSTWNVIFVSSGSQATDAQIVHDWLLLHGVIKQ